MKKAAWDFGQPFLIWLTGVFVSKIIYESSIKPSVLG